MENSGLHFVRLVCKFYGCSLANPERAATIVRTNAGTRGGNARNYQRLCAIINILETNSQITTFALDHSKIVFGSHK